MDIQKLIDMVSKNRKPLAALCLTIGVVIILVDRISTFGMAFTLLGLIGLFWDNISQGASK